MTLCANSSVLDNNLFLIPSASFVGDLPEDNSHIFYLCAELSDFYITGFNK